MRENRRDQLSRSVALFAAAVVFSYEGGDDDPGVVVLILVPFRSLFICFRGLEDVGMEAGVEVEAVVRR